MRALLLAAVLAVGLLAGCSSPSESTSSTSSNQGIAAPQPQSVHLSAVGAFGNNLRYSPNDFTVISGGQVTVRMHNDVSDDVSHNWVIDGVASIEKTEPGLSHETTFTAPAPGEYEFFCSIGGHKAAGLTGTMTVAVS